MMQKDDKVRGELEIKMKEGDKVTKLRELRKQHGFTQQEMAIKLNVSLRTYQRIEYGQQKPNIYVIIGLQQLFRENIEAIIQES